MQYPRTTLTKPPMRVRGFTLLFITSPQLHPLTASNPNTVNPMNAPVGWTPGNTRPTMSLLLAEAEKRFEAWSDDRQKPTRARNQGGCNWDCSPL